MKPKTSYLASYKGFSLVELLVVIAVIAIIAAIAIPNIANITSSAQAAKNQRNAQTIASVTAAARAAGWAFMWNSGSEAAADLASGTVSVISPNGSGTMYFGLSALSAGDISGAIPYLTTTTTGTLDSIQYSSTSTP